RTGAVAITTVAPWRRAARIGGTDTTIASATDAAAAACGFRGLLLVPRAQPIVAFSASYVQALRSRLHCRGRARWLAGGKASFGFDHDVGVFHTDGKRFGREGTLHKLCSRLHGDGVVHEAHALGIAPGAPRADVELPGMPGTADDLTGA